MKETADAGDETQTVAAAVVAAYQQLASVAEHMPQQMQLYNHDPDVP